MAAAEHEAELAPFWLGPLSASGLLGGGEVLGKGPRRSDGVVDGDLEVFLHGRPARRLGVTAADAPVGGFFPFLLGFWLGGLDGDDIPNTSPGVLEGAQQARIIIIALIVMEPVVSEDDGQFVGCAHRRERRVQKRPSRQDVDLGDVGVLEAEA
jgi:hypothetical protein